MRMNKTAHSVERVITQISRIAGIISIVFLIAMMLLTVTDVFLRYFFNKPVLGSMEMTEYLMVGAGFLGISWCAVKRAHVKVDLVVEHFPPRVQAIVDGISYLLALTVVPLVAWQNFAQAEYAKAEHVSSDLLGIPAYPFYDIVGFTFTLLSLVLLVLLVETVVKGVKR